jgi:hydroxyacid-oxoacid transhydrogenase
MSASNIRYGPGVTREVGFDMKNMGCKNVLLFTDPNLVNLEPVKIAIDSLTKAGVTFEVNSVTFAHFSMINLI